MIEEIVNSYRLVLDDVRLSVDDLTDGEMVLQFPGVPNHPAWTIGHLIHSAESIGGEIGLSPWLPPVWQELFRTGSTPKPIMELYPVRTELLGALDDAQSRITRQLGSRGSELWKAPLPDVRYRSMYPTVGHAVVHILSGHTSFHLGQLGLWRRAAGLPSRVAS